MTSQSEPHSPPACACVGEQVFDLADSRPAPVLSKLWENLSAREAAGDEKAGFIRRWVVQEEGERAGEGKGEEGGCAGSALPAGGSGV